MCCNPCHCKLAIVSLVLASFTSFLQVVCIYLEKYEEEINTAIFPFVTMFCNAGLAAINAFQIGLKREAKKETPERNDDVESTVIQLSRATEERTEDVNR